jgi:hypothetical protein
MRPRPEQPEGHESKCPCLACNTWANDLLDWESEEVQAGRNPWADVLGSCEGI